MATTINNASLNYIVLNFVTAYKARNIAVATLRDSLNKARIQLDKASLKQPLMESVAMAYSVDMVQKDRGAGVTWDLAKAGATPTANQKESVNAKRCYATLISELFKGAEDHKEELTVPADIQALLNKAWKLCGDYEQAGKLMATAIANAKAQK